MSRDEEWGVGDQANSKAFRRVKVASEEVELIHGQHPHSRAHNTTYARFPDGSIEAFDGHDRLLRMEFDDYNYLKTSYLSGNEVRQGGTAKLYSNGELVSSFFYRDPMRALDTMASLVEKLAAHPCRLLEPAVAKGELLGRHVYYMNEPGIITHYFPDQSAIVVAAEPGKLFPVPAYAKGDPYFDEDERATVKVDVHSTEIYWYRD